MRHGNRSRPASRSLRQVSYEVKGPEIDILKKTLSDKLIHWQNAGYIRFLKLELLNVDAEILTRLAPAAKQTIEVEIARSFHKRFKKFTQRGNITQVHRGFQTLVAECHEKIAQACLSTAPNSYEYGEMLSRDVPRLLTGFMTRYLERST